MERQGSERCFAERAAQSAAGRLFLSGTRREEPPRADAAISTKGPAMYAKNAAMCAKDLAMCAKDAAMCAKHAP